MTGTSDGTTKFAARGHEKGAGSPAPLIRLCLVDYAGISRTILPIPLPSCIRWRADGHIPIRGGTLWDSRKPTRSWSRGERFESARGLSALSLTQILGWGSTISRGFTTSPLHHPVRNAPQWCASRGKGFSLDKRILQATAIPRNPSFLPYKEEVAGSNPASPTTETA